MSLNPFNGLNEFIDELLKQRRISLVVLVVLSLLAILALSGCSSLGDRRSRVDSHGHVTRCRSWSSCRWHHSCCDQRRPGCVAEFPRTGDQWLGRSCRFIRVLREVDRVVCPGVHRAGLANAITFQAEQA